MGAFEIFWRLLAGVLLIATNAFFVSIEFALTRLRQFSPEDLEEHPGLQRAWEMTERLEIYLTGCQLGISVSSIILGVVAEPAVTHLLLPLFEWLELGEQTGSFISVVVAVIIINLIHKIWGEQAPTYLGVERPREVSRYLAPILYWWSKVMYPVIYAGDGLAKSTLRLIGVEITRSWTEAEEAEPEREIEKPREEILEILSRSEMPRERRHEIMNAFDIGDMRVEEIMVDREKIVALSICNDIEENLSLAREHHFNRFPLIEKKLEDYIGNIYVTALFQYHDEYRNGEIELEDFAAGPMTVGAEMPVAECIDEMQAESQELALVTENGKIVGLVTATDAFEAIIGDLEDPLDV